MTIKFRTVKTQQHWKNARNKTAVEQHEQESVFLHRKNSCEGPIFLGSTVSDNGGLTGGGSYFSCAVNFFDLR